MGTTRLGPFEEDPRAQQRFQERLKQFFERWAPEDQMERADFHAEFHHLVQLTYLEAQRPFAKAMADAISAQPSAFLVPMPDKRQG